jgi:hypothetical protein
MAATPARQAAPAPGTPVTARAWVEQPLTTGAEARIAERMADALALPVDEVSVSHQDSTTTDGQPEPASAATRDAADSAVLSPLRNAHAQPLAETGWTPASVAPGATAASEQSAASAAALASARTAAAAHPSATGGSGQRRARRVHQP